VRRIDGREVTDAQQLRASIRNGAGEGGQPLVQRWDIEREGRLVALQVTPEPERLDGRWVGRVGAYIGERPAMVTVSR